MDEAADNIDAEVSAAWATVNDLINGFLALLPKLVIAAVVFLLFILVAEGVRSPSDGPSATAARPISASCSAGWRAGHCS